MNHPRQTASPPTMPIPIVAYSLPFAILAATAVAVRDTADARTWSVLVVGFVVLLVLAAIGPLRSGDASERYPEARRVLLSAMFAIMVLFSLCCAYVAVNGLHGPLNVYPVFVFVPGWILFAQLVPLWVDSPVIRTDDPDTGWKTLGRLKLLYSDPDDAALWVYGRPWIDDLTARVPGLRWGLYAPNLGHQWGRAVMTTIVVLILASMAMLIATVRPNGLLP